MFISMAVSFSPLLRGPGGKARRDWLAVSAMLARMPQLKATGPVPAAIQQICLSTPSWECKLAKREFY